MMIEWMDNRFRIDDSIEYWYDNNVLNWFVHIILYEIEKNSKISWSIYCICSR